MNLHILTTPTYEQRTELQLKNIVLVFHQKFNKALFY